MTAYGSGAGSDSFVIRVEDEIVKRRGEVPTVQDYIGRKIYINYATYAKFRKKIKALA
jgi:hydroxymethylglutaryl-CoA synthase